MSEYRLPIPTAAPDNVVAKLPPVFRVQSISRLPLDELRIPTHRDRPFREGCDR